MRKDSLRAYPLQDRLRAIFDRHSLEPLPLPRLGRHPLVRPASDGDGVLLTSAKLYGRNTVYIGAQDATVYGGTVSVVNAACLCHLFALARIQRPDALVLFLDTGGVRLHDPVSGILGVVKISQGILELRENGIPCIAVICGRLGCFGGATLIAGVCDTVLMGEDCLSGLSGPKVLEALDEDSNVDVTDSAAIKAIFGAAHRRQTGEVSRTIPNTASAVRRALAECLDRTTPLTLEALTERQSRLATRVESISLAATKAKRPVSDNANKHSAILESLFPALKDHTGRQTFAASEVLHGEKVSLVGANSSSAIDFAGANQLSAAVLDAIAHHDRRPILLLADTVQEFSMRNERLGFAAQIAHLTECIALAKQEGHRVIALLRHMATGATFVGFGMMADTLYALGDATIHSLPPRAIKMFKHSDADNTRTSTDVETYRQLGIVKDVFHDDIARRLSDAITSVGAPGPKRGLWESVYRPGSAL